MHANSMPQEAARVVGTMSTVIGWKEHVWFPEWRLRLKAKVDTGARTSALDVERYEISDHRIRLWMVLDRKRQRIFEADVPLAGMVKVRNSGGHSERRPLIVTTLSLGTIERPIRLTITRRPLMQFRLLLGREALAGDFVVDVAQRYLLPPRED